MLKKIILIIVVVAIGAVFYSFTGSRGGTPKPSPIPQKYQAKFLKAPEGFRIAIFAKYVTGARAMAFDPDGNLLASETYVGKVVALPDKDADGFYDKKITVAEGLKQPHGLTFMCGGAESESATGAQKCWLYVAESNKISRYDYNRESMKAENKVKIVDLPGGGSHFTRTIGFGPDGRLYVSIGSSCNVCVEKDSRRAKIFSMNPDGGDFKEFAKGLRNAVFFTWHPLSGKMWAAEMGRDGLGDDLPPDEINIIEQGKNYGWPVCYGKNIHDTVFDKNVYVRNPCQEPLETESYIDIPAHSAPLGLAFFPGRSEGEDETNSHRPPKDTAWPEEYWYNLLVAEHGSANKKKPAGYKIVRYLLDEKGNYLGEEDFITGWFGSKNKILGRPVDILFRSGVIYISDDKAGVIYKVWR